MFWKLCGAVLEITIKDFITAVDENNVIVVKELVEPDAGREIDRAAKIIDEFLEKRGLQVSVLPTERL